MTKADPTDKKRKEKAHNIKYYKEHREEILGNFHADKERRHFVSAQWRIRKRLQCLEHYGGKCACCGEDHPEFLAFDHINNDGSKQRRAVGGGTTFALWLIKNNYPTDIQILCHNCNQARGFYGYCPHEKEREASNG
jgi:hypothetical protein